MNEYIVVKREGQREGEKKSKFFCADFFFCYLNFSIFKLYLHQSDEEKWKQNDCSVWFGVECMLYMCGEKESFIFLFSSFNRKLINLYFGLFHFWL